MIRRSVRLLAAVGLAVALLGAPSGAIPTVPLSSFGFPALGALPVAAATPDLTLVTAARYVVQPDRSRVHVVVDITATNRKPDTTTRTYFFDTANLAVLPATRSFAIASDGARPTVRVTAATRAYTLLTIGLGRHLASGQTQRLRLQFDLPDPGGSPTRAVRVGSSLVAFPVWAFASDGTPGSSVTVIFPAGYEVAARTGTLPAPSIGSGGVFVYRTGALDKPLAYYAYLTAERTPTLVSSAVRTTVGQARVNVTLRRWADDPGWADRVGDVFLRGLPALASAIGLPYPAGTPLVVRESTSRATGGYAGLFDARTGTVEVAYDADRFVALHEAAHVWFNGGLLADRWASEAFASYYAADVAGDLDVPVRVEKLTTKLAAGAFPLNAWGAVGREAPAAEDYGYAASYRLATLIGGRAGPGVLRSVWTAIEAGEAAYQPVLATLPRELATDGPPDWRALLDLLEERTGIGFADLWSSWVARPSDAALLRDRSVARARYAASVRAAGDWELSPLIRRAMDGWRFAQATRLLDDADAAIAERARLTAAAAAQGLALPLTARDAFEGQRGPAAALAEMRAELVAIDGIAAAGDLAAAPRGVVESVGLLGERPEAELAAARAAFATGDLGGVAADLATARSAWLGAVDVGWRRIVVAALGLLLASGALLAGAASIVRRRRRDDLPARISAVASQTRPGGPSRARPGGPGASPGGPGASPGGPGASPGSTVGARSVAAVAAGRIPPSGGSSGGRYGTLGAAPAAEERDPSSTDRPPGERGEASDVNAASVATGRGNGDA